jgi:hypothetical protein
MVEYRDLGQVSRTLNPKDPQRIGSGTDTGVCKRFSRQGELQIYYFSFKIKKQEVVKFMVVFSHMSFVKENKLLHGCFRIREPGSSFRSGKKRSLSNFFELVLLLYFCYLLPPICIYFFFGP